MSTLRPLPLVPNLEFERKEAKALLRKLKDGDAEALRRARAYHPDFANATAKRDGVKLADAQLVIAREYGFASWPRLTRYFQTAERHRHRTSSSTQTVEFHESQVRGLIARHGRRRSMAGQTLAAYVPRLYGMSLGDVFLATVSEDEARHAVARNNGLPSWDSLMSAAAYMAESRGSDWEITPLQQAAAAMASADLVLLQHLVAENPALAKPPDRYAVRGMDLVSVALDVERNAGIEAMRSIFQWLSHIGLDVQRALNTRLCGGMHMKPDDVRYLLARGANANWVAPTGLTVLEHALIRYWNGDAVDVLAAHAKPQAALWIAAGLGDLNGVRQFFDTRGKLTLTARENRPDFTAVGPLTIPTTPNASDEEILCEAFFIAMLNGRTDVLKYLVAHGFPIDSMVWETPMVQMAVGNGWIPVVECLVQGGANLDLAGSQNGSARDMATYMLLNQPPDADRRRVAELCGLDPDALIAERDARVTPTPKINAKLRQALELAADDAARLGLSTVGIENLFFGLLRHGGLPLMYLRQLLQSDFKVLRALTQDRVRYGETVLGGTLLPTSADANAIFAQATDAATSRRRDEVNGLHLLYALAQQTNSVPAKWLEQCGSNAAALIELLESGL